MDAPTQLVANARVAAAVLLAAAAAALFGCSAGAPLPESSTRAAPVVAPVTLPPAAATVTLVTAAELGASWAPGCPVGPAQLRRVEVNHLGFDGQTHRGRLVVDAELTQQVVAVFDQLYRMHYPIEKIGTVDRYAGAADELSMEDNNTSAFNCRRIPGSGRWALHAYGRAIDVNPLLNPSVSATVEPRNAAVYLDRHRIDPGLLHDGDPAVRAFTDRGWRWGGHWKSPVDYQHFELPH